MTETKLPGMVINRIDSEDTYQKLVAAGQIGENDISFVESEDTSVSLGLTGANVGDIIKVKAVDENGKPTAWEAAELPSGDIGSWHDAYPLTELTEDIMTFELTDINAKKLLIYGYTRLNDADNTLTTGSKRVAFYLNDEKTYTALVHMYLKTNFTYYFEVSYDVSSGILTGNHHIIADYSGNNNISALNKKEINIMTIINKLKINAGIDGNYYIKTGSCIGVKAYV